MLQTAEISTSHAGDGAADRPVVPCAVPRAVRRALDFIDANVDSRIGIADLIAAAGVSPRTLFNQFRRFVGVSPMTWLRLRRLDRARDALMRGTAQSVTEAALLWGITHLGRFSADYLRRFGELPSATLSAARRRSSDCAKRPGAPSAVPDAPCVADRVTARMASAAAAARSCRGSPDRPARSG